MIAAISAVTQIVHAIDTFAALGAVISAYAVKTASTLTAQLIVGTVFALFPAFRTDNGTVRASVTAGAYLLYAFLA